MLPLILGMSLPAMFSMLIQALYNVVDSIFVARYSPKALSAVSLAFPMQLIMVSFCVGTAIGVNSLDDLYFAYGSDDACGAAARLLLTKANHST